MTEKKDASNTELQVSKKRWARCCKQLISRLNQTTAKLVASEANVQMVKEISLRGKAKKELINLRGEVRAFVAVKPEPRKNRSHVSD